MKKGFFYLFFSTILFFNCAIAQENTNYAEIVNSTAMPSDEEIMQVIEKFNFDESQKQQLFKETKKRLENMYENNDYSDLIQGQEASGIDLKQINSQKNSNNSKKRNKKYSNHEPLTRRSN